MKQSIRKNQRGAVLVTFALFLVTLLLFTAIGIEAGRWYLARAELSKSVDAAALVAAKNISNPFVQPRTIGLEIAQENFPSGYLSTPGSGNGSVSFTVDTIGNDKIQVTGRVSSKPFMGQASFLSAFPTTIPTVSTSVAQKKEVEIMLVLDRSGSMDGRPIADLKTAAKTFVGYFASTQDKDKMGLITFATSVTVDRPLGINYVNPLTSAINSLDAIGATNPEDALIQAIGPSGFTDQTGVPGDQRIQQFLIFFSDGRPTAFRGNFLNHSANYDAVGCVTGNCEGTGNNADGDVYDHLGSPSVEDVWIGNVHPANTGNGIVQANCPNGNGNVYTTRWYAFDTNPVPGYAPTAQCIPDNPLHDQICNLASGMALANSATLKNRRITIYTIGLGSSVNSNFMKALASGPALFYYAPTSAQLQALFQQVAQEIKLRLVQ